MRLVWALAVALTYWVVVVPLVVLALLSVVGVASAQAAQALPQGTRVRITPADPSPVIVGELIAVNDSILMVRRQRAAGDITIPRSLGYMYDGQVTWLPPFRKQDRPGLSWRTGEHGEEILNRRQQRKQRGEEFVEVFTVF